MTANVNVAEGSIFIDENVTEERQSHFCRFRGVYCAICRIAFAMSVCLAVVGGKSYFFDYYKSCDKSNHVAYWIRSILISTFGFAVQVIMPYRIIIGKLLCKKIAVCLWVLCVVVDAACRASVRHCDIPRNWLRATTALWTFADDSMSWMIVPAYLYFKLGIRGFSKSRRCIRIVLMIIVTLAATVFDVARYRLPTESPLYQWVLPIPRASSIVIIALIYVFLNRNVESQVFLTNPVNRIELAALYNLLQGVLNDLSYTLHYVLTHANHFTFTIRNSEFSWIKVPIFFGYTVPMLIIALTVQRLIEGRVNETTKPLLMFAFNFFQTYLTAMLITSTQRIDYIYFLTLFFIILYRTFIIYVSLIDGFAKIFSYVSNKCRCLCCKKHDKDTSDIQSIATDSTELVHIIQKESQQTKPCCLFNPKHLADTHDSIAVDRIVERVGALICYATAITIFLVSNSSHPTAESQFNDYQITFITRALICVGWFIMESIVTVILIIFLCGFKIQLGNLRFQLYELTNFNCLFVFVFIIFSYVSQTYRLWQ